MFIIIGSDEKEYGPVTADQVRAWIAAGRADLDTKAKAAGSDEWRRVGDFPEFGGASVVPPVMRGFSAEAAAGETTPLAGHGARIGAAVLNAFFYLLCTMPGSMMISRKLVEQNPELAEGRFPSLADLDLSAAQAGIKWVWAGLLFAILLQSILLALRGQNLGKLAVGVRVVKLNGEPAGVLRGVFLRYLLPVFVMMVLNILFPLGFLFLFVDFCFIFRADRRCLHDLIAGTKVVAG
jgi:uncharacterized RDD family membrane protein YckC